MTTASGTSINIHNAFTKTLKTKLLMKKKIHVVSTQTHWKVSTENKVEPLYLKSEIVEGETKHCFFKRKLKD